MQPLITTQEFSNAVGLNKLPLKGVNNFFTKALKINKVNDLYKDAYDEDVLKFIEKTFAILKINIDYLEKELDKIPKKGPFITVSNHPYGALDGLILLYLVLKKRPDFKIMGNFLLQKIAPLKPYLLEVNPFGEKVKQSSFRGMKAALECLNQDAGFGVFPAGEVSSFQKLKTISDNEWKNSVLKLIKQANVPVIPIYFHGTNSPFFHLLGLINPNLRTLQLPAEMFKKQNSTISVRIGSSVNTEEEYFSLNGQSFGKFLRAKTYALGSNLEVKKFFVLPQYPIKKVSVIDEEVNKMILLNEINGIQEFKLFDWGDYEVYCCKTYLIPKIIQNIGVLRERTFRAVGEGTGKSMDIDEYDIYYEQLFIWDKAKTEIVGGYRIGKGKNVMSMYGAKGFYLNSLFRMKQKFNPILEESIELGRSFVVPHYQKKAFPLFCLWKGIMMVLAQHPEYRYLIGPVSISNKYSELSKSLIIDCIQTNYFDYQKAKMIKPRKKYKSKYKNKDYKMFIDYSNQDLFKLDKIIDEIEGGGIKIPVLFKKYLAQNAKIIGFNQDPKFNNALDGLMILDVNDIPLSTVKSLTNDKNEYHYYLNRFYTQYTTAYCTIPQY